MKRFLLLLIYFLLFQISLPTFSNKLDKPLVQIRTSLGDIFIILYIDEAPITCNNFLRYVETNFYDQTIIHRVVNGYLIQMGGYDSNYQLKHTHKPIMNESRFTRSNTFGTVAMAYPSGLSNEATTQFFINLNDNTQLNFNRNSFRGYTVFAKVIDGFDTINKLKLLPVKTRQVLHAKKAYKLKKTPRDLQLIKWIRIIRNEQFHQQ
eukprot:COSAG01_NODE_7674_length_3103_cov_45.812305_3_plen_207_part_00